MIIMMILFLCGVSSDQIIAADFEHTKLAVNRLGQGEIECFIQIHVTTNCAVIEPWIL